MVHGPVLGHLYHIRYEGKIMGNYREKIYFWKEDQALK